MRSALPVRIIWGGHCETGDKVAEYDNAVLENVD